MADCNPTKLCECGCGLPAPISKWTNKKYGYVRGQPVRFINGHQCSNAARSRKHAHGHGHSYPQTPTYRSWASMIKRCQNPNTYGYHRYGGRGITVCDQWLLFENFLADMGERPPGKTLDRYPDNDGNYEPGNCRWATLSEQATNRGAILHSRRMITAFGEIKTMRQWSRDCRCSVSYVTLVARITQLNWPAEMAISAKKRN